MFYISPQCNDRKRKITAKSRILKKIKNSKRLMLFLDGKNTKKLLHTYFSATTTKNWLWLIFRIIIYVYHLIMISFYFYHLVISCDHVFPPQEMKFSILLHNFFFTWHQFIFSVFCAIINEIAFLTILPYYDIEPV